MKVYRWYGSMPGVNMGDASAHFELVVVANDMEEARQLAGEGRLSEWERYVRYGSGHFEVYEQPKVVVYYNRL